MQAIKPDAIASLLYVIDLKDNKVTISHWSMSSEMFSKNLIPELPSYDLQYQPAVRAAPRCVS